MTQADFSTLNFSTLNKATAKSFHQQRNVIKNVCRGKTVLCPVCQQPLKLLVPGKKLVPGKSKNDKQPDKPSGIRCDKGCTTIELDIVG